MYIRSRSPRAVLTMLALGTALLLSACSTSKDDLKQGQQAVESKEVRQARALKQGDPVIDAIDDVEIAGYCPVAYVAANQPVKGIPEHTVKMDGMTYWFVDRGAKEAYEANPEQYAVQYRGWCATALSTGQKVPSDATIFAVHKGNIYLFSNEDARTAFLATPDQMVTSADAQWSKLDN